MLDLRANEFAGDTLVSFIEVTILEFLEKWFLDQSIEQKSVVNLDKIFENQQ